ncbi:dethiobiotin synthase [Nocardioides limicola]|uniref:dethiobiotin synthase n=1 Tax=Nocardioides limicola TaxID=2803368 RepID=UPI00193C2DE5|nr:dethiobiotin synthase [Nocardioides sp. DJM-14]
MSRIVVITGTDTGVGKTVATAALAVRAGAQGSVRVIKPVQTGIDKEKPGSVADAAVIEQLTGSVADEYTALADPLAPESAARLRRFTIPPVREYVDRIAATAESVDTVLVEGAGGALVKLDNSGGTILDIATALGADGLHQVDVVIVTRSSLGTLNHTELTVEACRSRGIEPHGLVIGSWPPEPGIADRCNHDDLPRLTGVPMLAVIPHGVGTLPAAEFSERVPAWFRPPK